MFQQTFAIIRNTFFESIRQPIMLVVLVVATILIILANPLSAFTMSNDQRMYIDLGLASVFLAGALLAAFIATNVLGREIENKTALTVISKPVGRPLFVIGKYIGVAAALSVGIIYLSFVFLLVEQHTVLQTVRDPLHAPVILFGAGAAIIGVSVGIWCNYFYDKVFSSTVICITTPLAGLAYLFSLMFKHNFALQSIGQGFKVELWLALFSLLVAILILTAVAVAASTRLGQLMTLSVTIAVFLLGMMSDWFFGRRIESMRTHWLEQASAQGKTETVTQVQRPIILTGKTVEPQEISKQVEVSTVPLTEFATSGEKLEYALCWTAYSVVPNFQVMFLSDAVTQSHKIPPKYVASTAVYGALYITAALGLATMLFQRREVG
jgi:ABC-type transport system involved in multi-copper enzyme maturation permease subunit